MLSCQFVYAVLIVTLCNDNTLIHEFLQQLLYARALYTQQFSNICILRRNMICKICDNFILLPCGFYRHFFIVTFYRHFS